MAYINAANIFNWAAATSKQEIVDFVTKRRIIEHKRTYIGSGLVLHDEMKHWGGFFCGGLGDIEEYSHFAIQLLLFFLAADPSPRWRPIAYSAMRHFWMIS